MTVFPVSSPLQKESKTKHKLHQSYTIEEGVWCISFTDLSMQQELEVLRWRNHPDIRRHMYHKESISEIEHQSFLRKLPEQEKKFYWVLQEGNTSLGVIDIVNYQGTASEWGFYLNPDLFGQGKAISLLYHALNFFFRTLQFKQLYGFCHYKNVRALLFHDLFYIYHRGYQKISAGTSHDWYSHRVIDASTWLQQECSIAKIQKRLENQKVTSAAVKASLKQQIRHIERYDTEPPTSTFLDWAHFNL